MTSDYMTSSEVRKPEEKKKRRKERKMRSKGAMGECVPEGWAGWVGSLFLLLVSFQPADLTPPHPASPHSLTPRSSLLHRPHCR
jgi:hypothetical protein